MKLVRIAKDSFVFQLLKREKWLLHEVLNLYPKIPSNHLRISKSSKTPDQPSSQRLLEEALTEQRSENKTKLEALLSDPARWSENHTGFQLSLSAAEMEWLLQVLNDVRVGSWIGLGSPEQQAQVLNEHTAPHLWAMEIAGAFQMCLLHALDKT